MSAWFRHIPTHPKRPPERRPWRTAQHRLYCPGAACACLADGGCCDAACPLHLNTEGLRELQSGRTDEALALFDRALAEAEDCTSARCNRGVCKAMRGHFADALKDFEAVLERDPTSKPALSGAARAARDAGDRSRAAYWQTCYRAHYGDGLLDGLFDGPSEAKLTDDPMLRGFSAEVCAVLNLLLDAGRTAGVISRSGPAPLPDLAEAAKPTCLMIAQGLRKRLGTLPEQALNARILRTCAHAAIGMVHLRLKDPRALKVQGGYRMLTDGFVHVTDLKEHIEHDLLPEGSRLPDLHEAADLCLRLPERFPGRFPFAACAIAMYLFGLTLEADALGL